MINRRNSYLTTLSIAILMIVLLSPTASWSKGKLERKVLPTFQTIELSLDPDKSDYTGSVRIEMKVVTPVNSFRLHADLTSITTLTLKSEKRIFEATFVMEDGELTVNSGTTMEPGTYVLEISFSNDFDVQAKSLYRMETKGEAYAFTQFEEIDAREAFPCFDEPSFKLPYQLTLVVPKGDLAISNTPILSETLENGWKRIKYKATKPLPSYLLAIAVGPLETVDVPGTSIPTRVVTPAGSSHLTSVTVAMVPPILASLEEYFDSRYPFEKLDLIAVPEFWAGAMENPGAITFRESILLLDPNTVTISQKRRLATVLAHELAHMWFGDVVTMTWWDDLWLNEAFADWLENKTVIELFPKFGIEVRSLKSMLRIMSSDARPSSQPIRLPMESADRAMENLGAVYAKGSAILSMFEKWLGPDKFRAGVLAYIKEHEWGNATSEDLFEALSTASGMNVGKAMGPFIDKAGVPLVSVRPMGEGRFEVSQRRMANDGVTPPDNPVWAIPITLKYSTGSVTRTHSLVLQDSSTTIELESNGKINWIYPNADANSYFRWVVPPDMLLAMAESGPTDLSIRERVGFLSNLAALLDAGAVRGDDYLKVLLNFSEDHNPHVIGSVIDGLAKVKDAFVPVELAKAFSHYVNSSLRPVLDSYGLEPREGEDEAITLLRPRLIGWLGNEGKDEQVRSYSRQLVQTLMEGSAPVDQTLASTAMYIAALDGDREFFDQCRLRFENADTPRDRSRFLSTMGYFRDPELVDDALKYCLEGPLRPQELFTIPRRIIDAPQYEDLIFEWTKKNFDTIMSRIPRMYARRMPGMLSNCSEERLAALKLFFTQPDHKVPGLEVSLKKISDRVSDCVGLRQREGEVVATYLRDRVTSN